MSGHFELHECLHVQNGLQREGAHQSYRTERDAERPPMRSTDVSDAGELESSG